MDKFIRFLAPCLLGSDVQQSYMGVAFKSKALIVDKSLMLKTPSGQLSDWHNFAFVQGRNGCEMNQSRCDYKTFSSIRRSISRVGSK